jgi:hypothetical protein
MKRLICLLFGHRPNVYRRDMVERGVWHCRCLRCAGPLRYRDGDGVWRLRQ